MKNLQLDETRAKALYAGASEFERAILEATFGKDTFVEPTTPARPLGVWCLVKNGLEPGVKYAMTPEQYHAVPSSYQGFAVGVVTEDVSFMVHPGPSVVLPFGSNAITMYDEMVFDKESTDFSSATTSIIEAHDGANGTCWDDERFPFTGALAAEWCRTLGRQWHLPTLPILKSISKNIGEINKCMQAINGAVVTPGYYWTATVNKEAPSRAFVVGMLNGNVHYDSKSSIFYVRAFSAFPIENFKF